MLEKYSKLFSGKLDSYPHKQFHIDVDHDAKPVHACAYRNLPSTTYTSRNVQKGARTPYILRSSRTSRIKQMDIPIVYHTQKGC